MLHTHPPHLLALSLALPPEKRLRLPLFEAARFYPLLGLVPDLPPGTADLALAVAKLAETHPALWLERHGLITHGKTLQETLVLAEELEQLAKVQLLALSTNV